MADAVREMPRSSPLRILRVSAWAMAFIAVVPLFGYADLSVLPGWVNQQYVWAVSLEASWGSLLTFVVAGSCIAIALKPSRPWPGIVLVAVAAGTLVLGAALGANPRPLILAAIFAGFVAAATRLARRASEPFPRGWKLSRQYLVIAAAGVPLWMFYALHAFENARRGDFNEDSGTWGIQHWPVQGSTGLTLMISAVLLAFWAPGRGLLRVTTSLSSSYIGAAMLSYPDRAGAMDGHMWGVAMVLWGVVLALPLPGSDAAGPATTASARSSVLGRDDEGHNPG